MNEDQINKIEEADEWIAEERERFN